MQYNATYSEIITYFLSFPLNATMHNISNTTGLNELKFNISHNTKQPISKMLIQTNFLTNAGSSTSIEFDKDVVLLGGMKRSSWMTAEMTSKTKLVGADTTTL